MTLSDMMRTDITSVFIVTDDFAEYVTQYFGGQSGSSRIISAVVTLDEVQISRERGKGFPRRGNMIVADEINVTEKDAFLIEGDQYQVERIGPVREGIRMVYVIRYEGEYRGSRTAGEL